MNGAFKNQPPVMYYSGLDLDNTLWHQALVIFKELEESL